MLLQQLQDDTNLLERALTKLAGLWMFGTCDECETLGELAPRNGNYLCRDCSELLDQEGMPAWVVRIAVGSDTYSTNALNYQV